MIRRASFASQPVRRPPIAARPLGICLAPVLGWSASATAQEVSTPKVDKMALQEVVVTGSRIKRDGAQMPNPTLTLASDAIASTGAVKLQGILDELPAVAPGIQDNNSGNFSFGLAGLNMINLGDLDMRRTLVLVNGRYGWVDQLIASAVSADLLAPVVFIDRGAMRSEDPASNARRTSSKDGVSSHASSRHHARAQLGPVLRRARGFRREHGHHDRDHPGGAVPRAG